MNGTLIERQREAALTEAREAAKRHAALRDLVIGKSRQAYLGEVIEVERPQIEDPADISQASYVVEVHHRGHDQVETGWVVVHRGRYDSMHLPNRDMALLHLIAHRAGAADSHATGAVYAARLLKVATD